ncbi:MAG: hypothetical protein Q9N62_14015 [Ghiorsea sp.]|nr:hypothetical protein [Ghiorsea sp.]
MDKVQLKRRGFDLGEVTTNQASHPSDVEIKQAWLDDKAIVLPALLSSELQTYAKDIKQAHQLMQQVLTRAEVTPFLEQPPYLERIQENFFIVAASPEEHDEQGIEKIYVDAFASNEDDIVAEELWCKASWLSFHDEDASLRFRFSWGMEGYEDVSSDPLKQDLGRQTL